VCTTFSPYDGHEALSQLTREELAVSCPSILTVFWNAVWDHRDRRACVQASAIVAESCAADRAIALVMRSDSTSLILAFRRP